MQRDERAIRGVVACSSRRRGHMLAPMSFASAGLRRGGVTSSVTVPTRHAYRRIEKIGEGGMAVVSRYERLTLDAASNARSEEPPFYVAVKRIRMQLQHLDHYVEMFESECENVNSISSADLVHVYGVEEIEGFKSIVMEWVDGCSLNDLLDVLTTLQLQRAHQNDEPWFSKKVVTHIVRCLLRGLKDIHTFRDKDGALQCLIHRDVSPRNVLLSGKGEVKLADFGISKRGRASQIVTNGRPGTFGYMAPERLEPGEKRYDQSVDLYSVGAILFELISKRCYTEWTPSPGLSLVDKHARVRAFLNGCRPGFDSLVELASDLLEPESTRRLSSALLALDRIKALALDDQGRDELSELVRMAAQEVRRRRQLDEVDSFGTFTATAGTHDGSTHSRTNETHPDSGIVSNQSDALDRGKPWNSQTAAGEINLHSEDPSRPFVRHVGLVSVGALLLAGVIWVQVGETSDKGDVDANETGSSVRTMTQRDSLGEVHRSTQQTRVALGQDGVELHALIAGMQQEDEKAIETQIEALKAATEDEKSGRLRALSATFARYIQLTEDGSDAIDWSARCSFFTSTQEAVHRSEPRVCRRIKKRITEALGPLSEEQNQALRSEVSDSARDASLVEAALAVLEPWYRAKVSARLEGILASAKKKHPGAVPGTRKLRSTNGTRSGFSFKRRLSAIFSPSAWSQTIRPKVCDVAGKQGWEIAVPPEAGRELGLSAQFFASYDQAWRDWLASMDWQTGGARTGTIKSLQALGELEGSPLAQLETMVAAHGKIDDWNCDDEVKLQPFQLPFASDFHELMNDEQLAKRYAERAWLLAKYLQSPTKSSELLERRSNKLAGLERATQRTFKGAKGQLYAAMHEAITRPLVWAKAQLLAAPGQAKPSGETVASSSSNVANLWCSRIHRPFERDFAQRYPFSKRGQSAAGLQKVQAFFHPKTGALWRAVAALSSSVERKGNRFVLRPGLEGQQGGLTRQSLLFLNKAWVFSQAMFPAGRPHPRLNFELSLKKVKGFSDVQIIIGETAILEGASTFSRKRFVWPQQTGVGASLSAKPTSSGENVADFRIRTNRREWSLFWLLEQGTVLSDGFGMTQIGWSTSKLPDAVVQADIRLIEPSPLFFGPEWAPSSFLRVLRLRAPKTPLVGGAGC